MNVILVSLDTLRADHLSCYGYKRLTSPHLDAIAGQGVLFLEAFSPHIPTHPAHTSLFTGTDVMKHQIVAQGAKVELDPSIPTLPEILKEAGYFTAAADNLGRWFTRGFDVYEGYDWPRDSLDGWRKAEGVNATALKVLKACAEQNRPFFAFLHYWDPHTPYLPPPPFSRMFYSGDEKDPSNHSMDPVLNFPPFMWYFRQWMGDVRDIAFPCAQYDAEIAYMDTCLVHVWTFLSEAGLDENTLLVITSDHGEELDEHKHWFDHHGLYDTNLRVPLIMRCPGVLPSGARIGGFVRLMDVAPTILDILGLLDDRHKQRMDGRSALPTIRGEEFGTCDTLFLTESTWMRKRGIRTRRWKYIEALEPDIHNMPPRELYDLESDPGELNNLAEERPDVVNELSDKLHQWVRKRLAETQKPDPMETQGITLRQIGEPPSS
jgi:arylsulfatase A-like enzyme